MTLLKTVRTVPTQLKVAESLYEIVRIYKIRGLRAKLYGVKKSNNSRIDSFPSLH